MMRNADEPGLVGQDLGAKKAGMQHSPLTLPPTRIAGGLEEDGIGRASTGARSRRCYNEQRLGCDNQIATSLRY